MREKTKEILDQLGPQWRADAEKVINKKDISGLSSIGKEIDRIQLAINEQLDPNSILNIKDRLEELRKETIIQQSPGYQRKIDMMLEQLAN